MFVMEVYNPLSSGARTVLASKTSIHSNLNKVILDTNVTVAWLTPSVASLLDTKSTTQLRKLNVGGEMMTTEIKNQWISKVHLSNMYGPTEAAVVFMVNSQLGSNTSCSNIGRPVKGNEIYILDTDLRLAPVGVVGELCVTGCQLARGYLNRPDLTERAFVANPFRSGERMYRTGDLGRFNMDGTVEILGRIDSQIKLNGLRIELDEIEHTLHQHPEVVRACVLPINIDESDTRKVLIAFLNFHQKVAGKPNVSILNIEDLELGTVWIAEIRSLISLRLPPYMMPHIFLPISQMPTNTSGKIDRKQLETIVRTTNTESLYAFSRIGKSPDSVPVTDEEARWVKIWSPVLNIPEDSIGIHDSFFSLGGDSILSIKLVSLARRFGYNITVQQVFEYPTIATLALQAKSSESEIAEAASIERYSLLKLNETDLERLMDVDVKQNGISPDDVEDIYPCSPLQEGLFALGLRSNSDYLTQQVFRCSSSLDPVCLKAAWATIIEANPILRTTIVFTNSGHSHLSGLQIVRGGESIDWSEVECRSNADMDTELQNVLKIDRDRGIETGKLLTRFTVLRSEESTSYFIWTIHHTLYDGWSMGLILEDLVAAYNGQQVAKRPTYSRFIEYTISQDKDESIAYWSQILNQASATHISKQNTHSNELLTRTTIKERIQIDFSSLTGTHNLTIATIVNLAWALVVKFHTGNSDVVFGAVNSGRSVPIAEIDRICGPCISTLPVRVDLEDNPTLLEAMTRMYKIQVEQYRYQNIGLQDIQKLCVGELGNTLFDSLLAVQNLGLDDLNPKISSLGLDIIEANMPSNYAVVVEFATGSDEHELSILYDQEVLHNDEARWIFEHLKTALASIVDNADTRVDDFDIISSTEYEQLQQWSGSVTSGSPESYLHTLFEEQVLSTPNNIAVQYENEEFVTYSELNSRANRLAHHLIDIGVGIETMVPVCLDRSVNMIVILLAILKAGGAYVPMDPNNPDDRNHFIIKETKAEVVVTHSHYKQKFEGVIPTLVIIEDWDIAHYSDLNPVITNLTASNLCYVLYTSGSTGLPKGVLLEHGSVANFIEGMQTVWKLSPDDSVLQFASYTFDLFVIEVYVPLLFGARTSIANKAALHSSLNEAISEMNVTTAMFTPTVASLLIPGSLSHLRKLCVGGEMMTAAIRDNWTQLVQLSNAYGPTEAAVAFLITESLDQDTSCSNVGKPLGNNKIFIMDSKLRLVPLGVVGELCVAGVQIARGYLGRPEQTTAAFVPNPFEPGERLYRTGDLARFNIDGSVEVIGRKDNQIKLRGLRIELDEIEHTLHEHSEVNRACIIPLNTEANPGSKVLVAFLVFHGVSNNEEAVRMVTDNDSAMLATYVNEIRSLATKKLPPYMIQSLWVPLNRMPCNNSGKIDRKSLSVFFAGLSTESVLTLSRSSIRKTSECSTELQRAIQEIWAETLNIDPANIGLDDPFYHLGGDSISAIRVSSISRQKGISLSVQQIMQNTTIRELAAVSSPLTTKLDVLEEYVEGPVPLTPILRYFLEQKQTNIHHFNQSWLLRLQKPTSSEVLKNAVGEMIKNHDILRARFLDASGKQELRVLPPAEVFFEVQQHHMKSADEVHSDFHQLKRGLNISDGQLFQFALYDIADGKQLIFMTIHHSIIDLVSWRIIWDDLEQLLQGRECNYKSLSFMKWSKMLTDYSQTLDLSTWTRYPVVKPIIDDCSLLERNLLSTTKALSFSLSRDKTDNLFGLCNRPFQTEPLDLMISSLALAYCQVFDSSSITIGMEGHGRETWCESIDISRTVGWFTSIYPITIEPMQTNNALDTLKSVKDLRKLIPNNGFTYGVLRHLTQNNRLMDDKIQIGFNYVGRFQQLEKGDAFFQQPDDPFNFDTCQISPEWKRDHVFEISVGVNRNRLEVAIVFSTALHSHEIVSRWINKWQENLTKLIDNCARITHNEHTRSDFPLLSLSESDFHLLYHKTLPEANIDANAIEDILPCTHLQVGLIAGMLKDPEYYHVQQTYKLLGHSNIAQLKSAWEVVLREHPILRTIFVENPIIRKNCPIFLQIVIKDYTRHWFHVVCDEDSLLSERAAYLARDKINSFLPGQPTMRFALLETTTGTREMIISWHHAILDATSWSIVLADFDAVYHMAPRPTTYPFKNFVSTMVNQTAENIAREKHFWSDKFALVDSLPFPKIGDHHMDSEISRIFGYIETPMSEILQFARQSSVTLFTLIQASWAILLRLYTQAGDMVFGYVVDGRNSEIQGIDKMVGPCINMLPCRIQYDKHLTIRDWLQAIQKDYASTFTYQQSSLRNIENWAEMSPLIDTSINYLPANSNETLPSDTELLDNAKGLTLVPCQDEETTEYPLALSIGPHGSKLAYRLDVSGKIANSSYAKIIANEYSNLFTNLVHAKPNTLLGDLRYVLQDDLLSTDDISRSPLHEACLHHEFERQVACTPNNVAVQFGTTEFITYSELNERANCLANYLIDIGVRPESMVPICFDKSVGMMVTILAVLKAGGAYVPIDPENPTERIKFIVEETNAAVIVTTSDHQEKFEGHTLVLLDNDHELIETRSSKNPVVSDLTPENLCYIIYTSGSTGNPKGVMLEHSAVLRFIQAQQEVWSLTEEDSLLQFASYTFDASVLDIYLPLFSGARVCMASKNELLTTLESVMQSMNVTCANLTSTIASKIHPAALPSLKNLQLGGEMMTVAIRDTWAPYIQLSNGYGPTEAAVAVAIQHSLDKNTSCSNVGKPIGFNMFHIVDSELRQVPMGVAGELCVSGPQLARGYLNRPDLTEAAFVKNPFGNGGRMYRTGDMAHFNADGSVELIGRKDNQIKLNGLRIELDEIDHVLHEHPKVSRACTLPLVVDKSSNRKALVAFVSFKEMTEQCLDVEILRDSRLSTYIEEIRILVETRLPHYMVPTVWLPLNRMPTNSSEKVDRKLLGVLFERLSFETLANLGLSRNTNRILPRTTVESHIQKIWSEVLNCPQENIGINESFRSLGGDSILAIQVSSLCRKLDMYISVQTILQHQTIGKLAELVQPNITEDLMDDDVEGPVLLTPNQRMFLGMKQTNVNHFNQAWLLQVRERISKSNLAKSIHRLVKKHDILRARFSYTNENWELKVYPSTGLVYEVHHSHVKAAHEVQAHIHQLQHSLDIVAGPLFQFALYDFDDGEQLIFMTAHHYIIDLLSWRIIWDDLEQLLQGRECNYRSMSFMKWSKMLAAYGHNLNSNSWPKQPVSEPLCSDPTLLAKNTVGTSCSLSFKLDSYFSKLASSYCDHSTTVTIQDLLLASLAYSFCSVFGKKVFSVALESHGRQAWDNSIDISRTVGWFTNIYPVSVSISSQDTILDVIRQTVAKRHQIQGNEVAYGLLRYVSNTNGEFDHDPLQISLAYMPKSLKLENNNLLQPISSDSKYNFDLESVTPEWIRQQIFNCVSKHVDEQLETTVVYSHELHSELQVQTLLDSWEATMIDAIVSICKEEVIIPSNDSYSTLPPPARGLIGSDESEEKHSSNVTTLPSSALDECVSLLL
ncbi:hypothetical protein K7432_009943 [Basidiobolus ranarum]|uniref:Carrier domain-containing protein n=1 Tax=Basidiobolus ranarum TaxID=34480 RepID=A0ABR2VW97_9FUNG